MFDLSAIKSKYFILDVTKMSERLFCILISDVFLIVFVISKTYAVTVQKDINLKENENSHLEVRAVMIKCKIRVINYFCFILILCTIHIFICRRTRAHVHLSFLQHMYDTIFPRFWLCF